MYEEIYPIIISHIWEVTEEDRRSWWTNSERLNRVLSYRSYDDTNIERAAKRYTLFPNKIREWKNK